MISFAGESLSHTDDLFQMVLHLSDVVAGYSMAGGKLIEDFLLPLEELVPSMAVGGLIETADDLKNHKKSEEKKMEKIVKGIVNVSIKVCVAGGTLSETALYFIERYSTSCVSKLGQNGSCVGCMWPQGQRHWSDWENPRQIRWNIVTMSFGRRWAEGQ